MAAASAVLNAPTVTAQPEAFDRFAEKQFYGNRIQAGSILLNGSIQATAFDNPDIEGRVHSGGFGLGIALAEFIVVTASYSHVKTDFATGFGISELRTNVVQAGIRFLPNTLAGFVQPYIGLEYLRSTQKNSETAVLQGAVIPAGFIFWISHFMAVTVQPFSISMLGNTGDDRDFNPRFDFDLGLTNPTFGISFLINGQRP